MTEYLAYSISAIFKYIAAAWEGDDGKFSYKRASQFIFVILISKTVYFGFQNIYQIYALLILTLTFLLLAMVISAPQILDGIRALKGLPGQQKPE